MKNWIYSNKILVVGIVLSTVLLIAFLVFQHFEVKFLDLDVKWIIIAAIPLILALIIGEYIYSIKGPGFEIITRIKTKLNVTDLMVGDIALAIISDDKGAIAHVEQLSPEAKLRIQVLRFKIERRAYYQPYAIRAYIRNLKNLKYFEVDGANDKFICLLPIDLFKQAREIDRFNQSLENRSVLTEFREQAITASVPEDLNLIDAYIKLKSAKQNTAVVFDVNRRVAAVIRLTDLERLIASEVVTAYRGSKSS